MERKGHAERPDWTDEYAKLGSGSGSPSSPSSVLPGHELAGSEFAVPHANSRTTIGRRRTRETRNAHTAFQRTIRVNDRRSDVPAVLLSRINQLLNSRVDKDPILEVVKLHP